MDNQLILAIEGCLISNAAARVAGTLLARPVRILTREEVGISNQVPSEAFLILCCLPHCNQASALVRLRANGFAGPTLVACTEPFGSLCKRSRILFFAKRSVVGWPRPFLVSELLCGFSDTVPLRATNLQSIQMEIQAIQSGLPMQIRGLLAQVRTTVWASEDLITELRAVWQEIQRRTPSLCHNTEIGWHPLFECHAFSGNERPSINLYSACLLDTLESGTARLSLLDEFEKLIDLWQQTVIATGEY